MNIDVDAVKIDGSWWSNSVPTMVLEEWESGRVRKRVRVKMSPSIISEIAGKLWELQKKHAETSANMANDLKGGA